MVSTALDASLAILRGSGAQFAYLHGSQAAGTARPDSDIDIAAYFADRSPLPSNWTCRPSAVGIPDPEDLLRREVPDRSVAPRVPRGGASWSMRSASSACCERPTALSNPCDWSSRRTATAAQIPCGCPGSSTCSSARLARGWFEAPALNPDRSRFQPTRTGSGFGNHRRRRYPSASRKIEPVHGSPRTIDFLQ